VLLVLSYAVEQMRRTRTRPLPAAEPLFY